jgi:hypothetical protein
MTQYRGYTIEATSTTVGQELHGGKGNRKLLKITDANGHAIRNSQGNLPIVTTIAHAKEVIRAEISA